MKKFFHPEVEVLRLTLRVGNQEIVFVEGADGRPKITARGGEAVPALLKAAIRTAAIIFRMCNHPMKKDSRQEELF